VCVAVGDGTTQVSQEAADEQVKNEEAPAGKEMPAWMVTEADRLKAAEAAANAPQEPDSQENKAQLDEIHQVRIMCSADWLCGCAACVGADFVSSTSRFQDTQHPT
jgi:hypothetical protein